MKDIKEKGNRPAFSRLFGDNRGLSMIELIVVVLIMGVLAGGIGVTMSVVYNADVKRAGETFMAVMTEARQKAMSAREGSVVSVKLYSDGEDCFAATYYDDDLLDFTKLSNYNVSIYAGPKRSREDGLTMRRITGNTASDSVTYRFTKSIGAIDTSCYGFEDIYFEGSDTYHVIVVDVTGRCYTVD